MYTATVRTFPPFTPDFKRFHGFSDALVAGDASGPQFPYFCVLQEHSTARRLDEIVALQVKKEQELDRWLRRSAGCRAYGYLEQLHSYIYCVSEPPPPPSGAPPRSLALWRLFWQLRPLLYGEHPIEEIVWQAEIERDAVAELIDAYEEHLVCVVMPGDACSHSVI